MAGMAQWFGPKEPGFETGIRSWQGIVALVVFLALMIGARYLPYAAWGLPRWSMQAAHVTILLVFAAVFYFHYQRD